MSDCSTKFLNATKLFNLKQQFLQLLKNKNKLVTIGLHKDLLYLCPKMLKLSISDIKI
jgi:hypothetical protein